MHESDFEVLTLIVLFVIDCENTQLKQTRASEGLRMMCKNHYTRPANFFFDKMQQRDTNKQAAKLSLTTKRITETQHSLNSQTLILPQPF